MKGMLEEIDTLKTVSFDRDFLPVSAKSPTVFSELDRLIITNQRQHNLGANFMKLVLLMDKMC